MTRFLFGKSGPVWLAVMIRDEFTALLKDLLPHLHDFAVLETHSLAENLTPPADFRGSRGEFIQKLIFEAVEGLQPKEVAYSAGAVEWRPYLILHRRYIEGLPLALISSGLSLSDRQVRRDHNRAVQALAGRLYDRIYLQRGSILPKTASPNAFEESQAPKLAEAHPSDQDYLIQASPVDLNELVHGATGVMHRRLIEEDVELKIDLPEKPPLMVSDRIILRQVLFSLFKYTLHLLAGKVIFISLNEAGLLRISFQVDGNWKFWREEEYEDLLDSVREWSRRLDVVLIESYPPTGKEGRAELSLELIPAARPVVLVVDDQQPALRMFERYLSRTGYEVVGVAEADQVLAAARQLRPVLITLDVMMPHLDGWEVLQALQLDEATHSIPVVVCSAWEEPELALSLGAAGFLKKPITQKDLLGMIDRVVKQV
jgi:CheY-like chemotaxis protein